MTVLAALTNLTLSPRLTKSTQHLGHYAYLATLFERPASEAKSVKIYQTIPTKHTEISISTACKLKCQEQKQTLPEMLSLPEEIFK